MIDLPGLSHSAILQWEVAESDNLYHFIVENRSASTFAFNIDYLPRIKGDPKYKRAVNSPIEFLIRFSEKPHTSAIHNSNYANPLGAKFQKPRSRAVLKIYSRL